MFDLVSTFQSGSSCRDNFLSRLFAICSEELVRYWGTMQSSAYDYIGRPTIYPRGESGYTTLDFAFRRRADGRCLVAEMKCELAYCDYRYMTLTSTEQVERHVTEQRKQGKKSFARFLEAAKTPSAYTCKVTTPSNRQVQFEYSGAILVWGRTTVEGQNAVMSQYGFVDVLSIESMVNDLLRSGHEPFREFLRVRQAWCKEMFTKLMGG